MSAQVLDRQASSVKILVFLVVFLLVLLVLQPFLWGVVKNGALALHERRTLAEQIKEIEIRIRDVRNNYESQSVYIDQLASIIPDSRDALQVIERLETATQGLDVQVEVSRIDEGTSLKSVGADSESEVEATQAAALDSRKPSGVFPLHITLVVTGPPEALVEYIDVVEHVQELSMVQKFTISPVVPKPGQTEVLNPDRFQLMMTAVFYLQDEDNGAGN
jgi:hypothetical protein